MSSLLKWENSGLNLATWHTLAKTYIDYPKWCIYWLILGNLCQNAGGICASYWFNVHSLNLLKALSSSSLPLHFLCHSQVAGTLAAYLEARCFCRFFWGYDTTLMAELRRSPVEVGSLSVYPIIYKAFYLPGGWPWDFFQPSTSMISFPWLLSFCNLRYEGLRSYFLRSKPQSFSKASDVR